MDIFISLIPALCWGNIGLVSRIMGGSAKEQTIGMTWGAFSLSLILTLIFKDNYLAHCTAELWITGFNGIFLVCRPVPSVYNAKSHRYFKRLSPFHRKPIDFKFPGRYIYFFPNGKQECSFYWNVWQYCCLSLGLY